MQQFLYNNFYIFIDSWYTIFTQFVLQFAFFFKQTQRKPNYKHILLVTGAYVTPEILPLSSKTKTRQWVTLANTLL